MILKGFKIKKLHKDISTSAFINLNHEQFFSQTCLDQLFNLEKYFRVKTCIDKYGALYRKICIDSESY